MGCDLIRSCPLNGSTRLRGQQLSFESRVEVSSCAAVIEQCCPQLVEDRQSPDRPGSPILQHESAPPPDAKVFDA